MRTRSIAAVFLSFGVSFSVVLAGRKMYGELRPARVIGSEEAIDDAYGLIVANPSLVTIIDECELIEVQESEVAKRMAAATHPRPDHPSLITLLHLKRCDISLTDVECSRQLIFPGKNMSSDCRVAIARAIELACAKLRIVQQARRVGFETAARKKYESGTAKPPTLLDTEYVRSWAAAHPGSLPWHMSPHLYGDSDDFAGWWMADGEMYMLNYADAPAVLALDSFAVFLQKQAARAIVSLLVQDNVMTVAAEADQLAQISLFETSPWK